MNLTRVKVQLTGIILLFSSIILGITVSRMPSIGIIIIGLGLTIATAYFIFSWPLISVTILLVLLPFQSLGIRFLQVNLGLSDNVTLLISTWKEFFLLVLILKILISGKYPAIKKIDILIGCFILILFFYIFPSNSISTGLYGFRGVVEPFAFYFIARGLIISPKHLSQILKYLFVAITLIVLFAFVQFLFLGEPFLWKYKAMNQVLSGSHTTRIGGYLFIRASATFTSPNHLGMYLAILMLIGLVVYDERRLTGMKYTFAAMAMLGGLLLTLSRSSWLAFGFGLVLYVLLKGKIRKRFLVMALIAALLSIPLAIQLNLLERIIETLTLKDSSAAGKLPSILSGLEFVRQNPLGIGLGMTGSRSGRFDDLVNFHSENYYVLMAMDIGIIGLFLYVVLLGVVVVSLYKTYFKVKEPIFKGTIFGTLLALIGASVGVMFIPSLQEIVVAGLMWFFIGVSVNAPFVEQKLLLAKQKQTYAIT